MASSLRAKGERAKRGLGATFSLPRSHVRTAPLPATLALPIRLARIPQNCLRQKCLPPPRMSGSFAAQLAHGRRLRRKAPRAAAEIKEPTGPAPE